MPSHSLDVAGDAYGLPQDDADETDFLIADAPPTAASPSRWPLLFSLLSRRQRLCFLLPAVISSLVAGGVAPFMTIVIGHAFDAFSHFAATPDKDLLTHQVGAVALQLVGLALGSFALSSLTSYLWILTGEHNVLALRKHVYAAVAAKDMAWFDTREDNDTDQGPLGAGGLMAQFTRETDQVRAASSLATGRTLEYLTTTLTCLLLALTRAPTLTLVILSAVPVLLLTQAASQTLAAPLLRAERAGSAVAATLVDRACAPSGISTVKAFGGAPFEERALSAVLDRVEIAVRRLVALWGLTSGFAQFVMMALFVQGFWFGARVVRQGTISAGDVMAVFWACLMAVTNLQICVPQSIVLANGGFAMRSLLSLVDAPSSASLDDDEEQVVPPPCTSTILLCNITFSYPSRPAIPALRSATLSFPARHTTFLVGPSGSGKSTVAHLLAGWYLPGAGEILVDDGPRPMDVAVVGQGQGQEGCVVFDDLSVHRNIALASRRPSTVSAQDVEEACKLVHLHEFIVDGLPGGYDSLLGGAGGMSLSGGQRQRLALARAVVRDPDVLVLDEATSALPPTARLAIFSALRLHREARNRTTVVITHDLAQIREEDFVYVLKDGCVVESGLRADLEGGGVFGELVGMGGMPKQEREGKLVDVPASAPTPVPEKKTEEERAQLKWGTSLPFGHLFLSTMMDSPPSAHTRVPFSSPNINFNVAAIGWHRTPSMWKPLPLPSSVFKRPGSWRSAVPELVLEKTEEAFGGGDIKVQVHDAPPPDAPAAETTTLWSLLREVYPTIPCRKLVFVGLVICVLSGAATPTFSFLLSRLLFEVSTGAQNVAAINKYGVIVLGVAAADGLLMGLKYFLMQTRGMAWVMRLRKLAYKKVLAQDKKWFDARSQGGALSRVLIQDGDDARELLASVVGQCLVVAAMFSVGLVWALAKGWQLALVGFAIVPVFAGAMALQAGLVARCEVRNKRARERVAGRYYETIANVRGVRAMGLESVLRVQFARAAEDALRVSRGGAFVEGCTYGVACGLIYLAEGLLFYFGAVLVARGTYTYLQMVEVLNLVVFTVTIGSQLMAFTQRITKSVQATRDFSELLHLPTRTDESDGFLRPRLDGAITFHDVGFSYPGRADAPVLQNINMEIQAGECVAIVGASGSGKSTIAALLQRLYEPAYGTISIGLDTLRSTHVGHLRQHVSVVSQHPALFDATIAENIAYGSSELSAEDVRRAAEAANVHDFIMSLPQGYETSVGENGALISGGQAQRLQIARALARPSRVFIFDECTSALDDGNQAAVLETIRRAKVGRTTVMITHKVPVMRMCDRILVVHEGRIAEEGTYAELMQLTGVFAALVQGGEVESV